MSGIDVDIQEVKKLFEQDLVFKPANISQQAKRKEIARDRLLRNWIVTSLKIAYEGDQEDNMEEWFDTHEKEWKARGLDDVGGYGDDVEFEFTGAMTRDAAADLVNAFLKEWSDKPGFENRVPVVGDKVTMSGTGLHTRHDRDEGQIESVAGDIINVKFPKYPQPVGIPKDRFVIHKNTNTWKVAGDATIAKTIQSQKGLPKIRTVVDVWHRGPDDREPYYKRGWITAIDNKVAKVLYQPDYYGLSVRNYKPDNPEYKKLKTKLVPLSGLYYDWDSSGYAKWREKESRKNTR